MKAIVRVVLGCAALVAAAACASVTDTTPGVSGRVTWNSVPVPGARLRLMDAGRVPLTAIQVGVTDADGAFTFHGVSRGIYYLEVDGGSSVYGVPVLQGVSVPADGVRDIGEIRLLRLVKLTSPAVGALGQPVRPQFSWEPCDGAERYQLNVYRNALPYPLVQSEEVGEATSAQLSSDLAPGTSYLWEVVAATGALGPVARSLGSTFTTAK
jgi:hypothetical protein